MLSDIKINCGVGDILLSRAILDGHKGSVGVSLADGVIEHERGPDHLPFTRWLFDATFAGFAPASSNATRLTPQLICQLTGLLPRWPSLPRSTVNGGYIVVSTKVRGLHRSIYDRFREDFVDVVRTLAMSRQVYLVGEREIGRCVEYDHHGSDLVYSIYGDLFQINGVTDATVPELGKTPPTADQFRTDCTLMAAADRVITVGTGGNTTMAMATGRCWSFVGHCEMEPFFAQMPWRPAGCFLTDSWFDFLEGLL